MYVCNKHIHYICSTTPSHRYKTAYLFYQKDASEAAQVISLLYKPTFLMGKNEVKVTGPFLLGKKNLSRPEEEKHLGSGWMTLANKSCAWLMTVACMNANHTNKYMEQLSMII